MGSVLVLDKAKPQSRCSCFISAAARNYVPLRSLLRWQSQLHEEGIKKKPLLSASPRLRLTKERSD
jgi:hypothetical protein